MMIEPAAQAKFERNYMWARIWPKSMFAMMAISEILLGLIVFLTELLNIGIDFWHTNVFGGIWASIILFINWILLFVNVCCATTIRVSTCAGVWNFITLIAFGVLIVFDVIFLNNPYTCLLTPTCSNQSQLISINSFIQTIPQFSNYSTYDSKTFVLKIQMGCAIGAFISSFTYIIVFLTCKIKFRKQKIAPQKPAFNPPPRQRQQRQAPRVFYANPDNDHPYPPSQQRQAPPVIYANPDNDHPYPPPRQQQAPPVIYANPDNDHPYPPY